MDKNTLHSTIMLSKMTILYYNYTKLTFGLVRTNGSILALGESEVTRVSANLAALLFSFSPSAAVTVNWL